MASEAENSPIDDKPERIRPIAAALRQTDSSAFLVEPRVVRRVICEVNDLTQFLSRSVPHADSCVVARHRIRGIVHNDELGLGPNAQLPERVILIAAPSDRELRRYSDESLLLITWRRLFHARMDLVFSDRYDSGRLTQSVVRERIDQIGQVEFDEIQSTLQREHRLVAVEDRAACYSEFAAIFFELSCFAPDWLETWFPSLTDKAYFSSVLRQDIDPDPLFEQTRIAGAPDPVANAKTEKEADEEEIAQPFSQIDPQPSPWRFKRYSAKAEKLAAKGNSIGAAIWRLRAAEYCETRHLADVTQMAIEEIEEFVKRLQAALAFDDDDARDWYRAIIGLMRNSLHGFWNADKKLLYDLQKVCVDHERESYTIDVVKFIVSRGKRPIKRPLPNQREVMMSKHLRSAAGRLVSIRLVGHDRERLTTLLREAAESAEHQMRTRLRPLIDQTFQDVQLVPANLPERVAYRKLIEECLDSVAERGFLTMGYLRDALSRNNLKLPDLQNVSQLVLGDRLLRADDRFDQTLDGVYHRGEFYLRWLQIFSSLFFGTRPGRFATLYMFIPFGGAFVALEGLTHLIHILQGKGGHAKDRALQAANEAAAELTNATESYAALSDGAFSESAVAVAANVATESARLLEPIATAAADTASAVQEVPFTLVRPSTVLLLGFVIMGTMHWMEFRRIVWDILVQFGRLLKLVLITLPQKIYQWPPVQIFLRSHIFRQARHFIITPIIACFVLFVAIPHLMGYSPPPWEFLGLAVVGISCAINSRRGRDIQEQFAEWLSENVEEIRAAVFVALVDQIYAFFKWLMNQLERVFYAVDEWLRFRSGESSIVLAVKSILGVVWSFVHFVLRFCVNLLIEPQINPIKHFPVVTVSHKLLLPTMPVLLGPILTPMLGSETAATSMAITIATLIPGVFGFLVWELKENWRLYDSNRSESLSPSIVGAHGETMLKLMKPGFHSGTLPNIFRRLRGLESQESSFRRSRLREGYFEQLRHAREGVTYFIKRELLTLLEEAPGWERELTVSRVHAASNSLQIDLWDATSEESATLTFQEQSGWLVSGFIHLGWLKTLDEAERRIMSVALAGLYSTARVDLVRERIHSLIENSDIAYDVTQQGLVIWPDRAFNDEAIYSLQPRPETRPQPAHIARRYRLPVLQMKSLLYSNNPIAWQDWVKWWEADPPGSIIVESLTVAKLMLLPPGTASDSEGVKRNA